MIVNRLDYRMLDETRGYGVGYQILETSTFDPGEVEMVLKLLEARRRHHGDGIIAIDCGANIGVHTIEWAKAMTGWGSVLAIEAQERIYYALAGNIAINNCFNAIAIHAAVSSEGGTLGIPKPDYLTASSFGSLELRQREGNEFIGQPINYADTVEIRKLAIDEFDLPRVDLIKLDVEGMELEALEGAKATIRRSTPVLLIEKIKAEAPALKGWLSAYGYAVFDVGINMLAVHTSDKVIGEFKVGPKGA